MLFQSIISVIHTFIQFVFFVMVIIGLCACQSAQTEPVVSGPAAAEQTGNVVPAESETTIPSDEGSPVVEASIEQPSLVTQPSVPQETPTEKPDSETPGDDKPQLSEEEIQAIYQMNPHASTFIVDETGQNNTCARCHSPVNWTPSMDDIPETCLTCKFEIKDPPPYIAEEQWEHIPCKVCHAEGKRGKINPEIAWLEIAQIGEYAAVASSTEICMKCHSSVGLSDHRSIQIGSVHGDYTCTQCHDAHSSQASCSSSGCHDQVLDPVSGTPGHDSDHAIVDCFACHDASGLEVGPDPETSEWTVLAYKSHQIELAAPCEKCHFSGNAWGLSVVE